MNMKINTTSIFNCLSICMIALLSIAMMSCDDITLPEEGSIPDETPPAANFSFAASEGDYKEISFTNLSISATDYTWNFGDGGTSTEANPTHIYAEDGMYTVSLTAKDKLNVENTYTETLEIVEPENDFVPVILNPGFDIEGDDSYRDNWRNGDLGGVLQITSSPVHEGVKAAKFPSAGDRIAYQLITVERETEYTLSFYYTMKESPVGSLTVSILAGDITNPDAVADATIASFTGNDQADDSTYVPASFTFNSGDNSQVAIFITNQGAECRADTFTIEVN